MKDSLFSSIAAYENAFESGLKELLVGYNELGVFILVMANAGFHPNLWEEMAVPLERQFDRLARDLRGRSRRGFGLDDAGDDLQVFRRLMEIGFGGIESTAFRAVGPWELQFNQLRAFRPARMSAVATAGVRAPFDQQSFNFNKPFLRKEILWHGRLSGRSGAIFYNKYPFVPLHGLLVPEPRAGHPQFLQARDHDYLWRLTDLLAARLPGIGFGYNSYGAFASINHLHFQMFQQERPLPVTDPRWLHNGGSLPYPIGCERFQSPGEAWRFIAALHRNSLSYNLIYLPGRVYCIPRLSQGAYRHSSWAGGFAWHEMAGSFTTSSRRDFDRLCQGDLEAELTRLSILARDTG